MPETPLERELIEAFREAQVRLADEFYCFDVPETEEARRIQWSLEIDCGEAILRCNYCKKRAMPETLALMQMNAVPVYIERRIDHAELEEEIIVTVAHGG